MSLSWQFIHKFNGFTGITINLVLREIFVTQTQLNRVLLKQKDCAG